MELRRLFERRLKGVAYKVEVCDEVYCVSKRAQRNATEYLFIRYNMELIFYTWKVKIEW